MRILVVGASGVIGVRLVPLLTSRGHRVVGTTRSASKADLLRSLGADPVICDVFNRGTLRGALISARPDAIIDQLTDLPDDVSRISEFKDANNRIRREGTANILAAVREIRLTHIMVQSIAWTLPGEGGKAIADMEKMVLEAGGVVLRYGQFYGPGTYHVNELPSPPRIHIDEAARRTVDALDASPGIVSIADREESQAEAGYY